MTPNNAENNAFPHSIAAAIVESMQSKGGDAALMSLAHCLGQQIDAEPADAIDYAPLLLEVLRELCWTPRTRAEHTDDRYRAFTEFGSATLGDTQEPEPPEPGA